MAKNCCWSFSISPSNEIQGWFSLGLTGFISLLSRRLSRVFSSTAIWKHQFCGLSHFYGPALTTVCDYWKDHSLDYTDFYQQSDVFIFNTLSRFVIAFLPRSSCLLISWLQSPSTVILEPKKRKSVAASTFPLLICCEVMGPDAMILVFLMFSFKQAFHCPPSPSSRVSLVPLLFLSLEWYHPHIWGCWYFSRQSWFRLVPHPAHHVSWCTLCIS